MNPRRRFLMQVSVLPAALASHRGAFAQTWPDKPVRIVLGLAPGGGADVTLRLVAEGLRERLGQGVVIENISGAGGTIASTRVARADPDGYTFEAKTISTAVVSSFVYKNLPYQDNDFKAVSMVARAPLVAVVSNKIPARDLKAFLALLKAEPRVHTYGSSGVGTVLHLAGEMFKSHANVQMTHVPYRGSAPALAALLAGDISMSFDTIGQVQPYIKTGKIHAIGIASASRTKLMPELPTIGATVPGFAIDTWWGIYAPAKTPKKIVDEMSAHIVAVLGQPAIRDRLNALSWETVGSTPEEFERVWRNEVERLGPLVKSLDIQAT